MREFLPRNAIVMALSTAHTTDLPSTAPEITQKDFNEISKSDPGKSSAVSFSGNLKSQLLFIREGSMNSDSEAARALFSKMLQAMGFTLESVLIACLDQTAMSEDLEAELSSMEPKTIITLGERAAQTLLAQTTSLAELKNQPQFMNIANREVRVIPTFAPATLLEKPELKKQAWADLQKALV